MIICDLLSPQKPLIQRLYQDLPDSPFLFKELGNFIEKTLVETILNKAHLPLSGLQGYGRRKAFTLLLLKVLKVFLNDSTPDLSATLKEADQGLYTLESLKQTIDKFLPFNFNVCL